MNMPILFVDEKEDEKDKSVKRYESTKTLLYTLGCEDTIEFIGDLELEKIGDEKTEKVTYLPNPMFNDRKLVIIHAAKGDTSNRFSSDMVEAIRALFPNTTFAEFSGSAVTNLDIRDLRFRRKEHIYKDGGYKLFLFTAYFKKYNQFVFDLLVKGENILESNDDDLKEVQSNLKSLIDELNN